MFTKPYELVVVFRAKTAAIYRHDGRKGRKEGMGNSDGGELRHCSYGDRRHDRRSRIRFTSYMHDADTQLELNLQRTGSQCSCKRQGV